MFTGIIISLARIVTCRIEKNKDLFLKVEARLGPGSSLTLGMSISCNGICLTVIDVEIRFEGGEQITIFAVQISHTTQCLTTAKNWVENTIINLELALVLGARLDGHLVLGHIDGTATIVSIANSADSHIFEFFPQDPEIMRYIANKGSVAIDGVSLTISSVKKDSFCVNIIPYTYQQTIFHKLTLNDQVNIEIDPIARYVISYLTKV